MATEEPRALLERLIAERGADYAGLSRLLGRNAAYVQQFIKRGVPRKLAEEDRKLLARYFGIEEELLGGPPPDPRAAASSNLVAIPRFDVSASAGSGALDGTERPVAHIGFDAGWLAYISTARPQDLSIIRVQGDSMFPTLSHGDDIMVDRSAARRPIQDGIYVLRREDALLVKRLTLHPSGERVSVASDNASYARVECAVREIDVIGRVVWAGRRIG